jgi:hypothetical protein
MADAIPTPAGQQTRVQSTVVIQQPMSQWQALKEAGWWSPMDWTMLVVIGLVWLSGLYWKIFGDPGALQFIALLLVTIILMLLWIIVLILRGSLFVLRTHADIATLPEASARIAAAYLSGPKV